MRITSFLMRETDFQELPCYDRIIPVTSVVNIYSESSFFFKTSFRNQFDIQYTHETRSALIQYKIVNLGPNQILASLNPAQSATQDPIAHWY